ncbi:unnamed protein product [Cylicocyclus nassatus]|uniref:SLC12A transporter C-terminal domain-containing protein n=1 Tax=Cylicocyclus nassatus TaxID=53992 RepID=A0AA36M7F7_CYLNA|nr:unnamed protein product [Cylicocyclus nassatus]
MGRSLLTCGYVIPFKPSGRIYLMTEKVDRQMNEWLRNHHIIAYPAVVASEDQAEGAAALLQATGVGKLRPNILMLGFKTNWEQSPTTDMHAINTFYEIILNAFEKNVGVAIFRNSNVGFDLTKRLTGKETIENEADDNGIDLDPYQQNATQTSQNSSVKESKVGNLLREVSSFVRMNHTHKTEAPNANSENNQSTNRFQLVSKHSIKDVREVELLQQLQRFRTKVPKGSIDIWWLKDDGGLTLLLPYLLQLPGAYLEGAHLRVFVPAGKRDSVNDDQRQMATLMQKFRIAASDVHVINTFARPPSKETMEEFNRYVNIFKEDYNGQKGLITEDELQNFRSKTNRYLRKAELLRENSQGADLVIVTLPIPRRTDMSSALYMSWLEVISRNMPPTLFVRGNRTSVLSYFD